MKRIIDESGVVHLRGMSNEMPLCGNSQRDLLGRVIQMKETSDRATCPNCAALYCRIKNAPWNEVDDAAMDDGMYEAVKEEEGDSSSVSE